MLNHYYSNPNVRARLIEFLGGASLEQATGVFITPNGHAVPQWYNPRPIRDLWQCLKEEPEIGRSLWDRKSLIAHLDIEYVNFDHPAEPYLEPTRTFQIQRSVVQSIQRVLLQHGIAPLHLLSGRGHHFVWQMTYRSAATAMLAHIGRVPETLSARYAQPQPPENELVDPVLGKAFAGLGQVLEFVAHCVLDASQSDCEIPIELTAVEAGPDDHGREVVSIDLSEYGDPLFTRSMRMPFSVYLKPHHGFLKAMTDNLPVMFVIPLHEMDDQQGLRAMRNVEEVVQLARVASVRIPEQSAGTENLVASYLRSGLFRFHEYFYAVQQDAPDSWPATYDRTPLDTLPACSRRILQEPNDWLLKPGGIQHIVRTMLALGWHPRHVSGLIRSKYERDFGWGGQWYLYDAATRADFYVRLFSGLLATAKDPLIDFNCRSTQEKGYCPAVECHDNLLRLRERLLERTDLPGKSEICQVRT